MPTSLFLPARLISEAQVVEHLAMSLILVPVYSVLSVYSVVIALKMTTEYTDRTEKTRNKKTENQLLRCFTTVKFRP